MARIVQMNLGQVTLPKIPEQFEFKPTTLILALSPLFVFIKPLRSVAIGLFVVNSLYQLAKNYEETGSIFQ